MGVSKRGFLAEFELYVMLSLVRLGPEAYGAAIRRDIEAQTGRSVAVGAVYATLDRLAEKELVTARTERPSAGRPRKFFVPTGKGRRAALHSAAMLRRMMDGVELVRRERPS